jgi:hypothetical protein
MCGIAHGTQPPFGKPEAEEASVIGQQFDIRATEHLLQLVGRHPDVAGSCHVAGLPEETVEVIFGARYSFALAGQNAGAMKLAKVVHGISFFRHAADVASIFRPAAGEMPVA